MADDAPAGAERNVWYRLGYALEQARDVSAASGRLASLGARLAERNAPASPRARGRKLSWPAKTGDSGRPRAPDGGTPPAGAPVSGAPGDGASGNERELLETLLAAAAGTLAARATGLIPARGRPGFVGLLRAGAAGAGAALLRELLRPLLEGRAGLPELDEEVGEAMLAGTARGLLYGALVEPRLPGPALLQGTLYGALEYLVSPWGGLTAVAGAHAPHRKVPLLASLFEDYGPAEDTFRDHLLFGVALALLYTNGHGTLEGEEA